MHSCYIKKTCILNINTITYKENITIQTRDKVKDPNIPFTKKVLKALFN